MSAAPVHFHPSSVYYNSFLPYPHNQFLINLTPVEYCCGQKGTIMPERAGNTAACGRIDPNAFVYSARGNPCWKMAGLASPESTVTNGFRAAPLPCDYQFFNVANANTLDYYANQLIPTSSAPTTRNDGADMEIEQPEGRVESKRKSGGVTQRQQHYHQRHHPEVNHPQARDLKNKARFSTTGLPSNYAIVRDTKMSLSSAPSSPVAGSLGSLGSNYHFVPPHVMMAPSFGVPQYKGYPSSSSCCSTKDLKISSSSLSSYSSRSSMSSTPSSSGISPRKRCADDANGGYCRKNRQHVAERDSITLRCSCDSCTTDEVTYKVDHVAITDGIEQHKSKRSKNEEVIKCGSFESSSGKSGKGRSTRKVKKSSKKRNNAKLKSSPRTSQQNVIFPAEFSFVAPRPFQESTDNVEVSGRYNLRSSAKGRKRDEVSSKTMSRETPSSNVHMVQSISPSSLIGSCEIDSNNNFTKACAEKTDQTPRYHTRSRQKKADGQQLNSHKRNNRVEGEASPLDLKVKNDVSNNEAKEYQLASVIRRVPSSTILKLLKSQPSTTPPKDQTSGKESAKDNTRKLSTLKRLYDIHGVIGVGGGGTVHAGTRKSDGIQVAIKQVPKAKVKRWGKLNDRVVPIEFELLHKASRSGHAGVIRMLDWFERSNAYILVMERPQPVIDLFDYLNQSGALPEATARNIFRQIARAILHCHANGVVHRDIKDENVLLNLHTSEAKLIDFGCGTVMKSSPYTEFAGTPEFYPPEWFIHRSYRGQRVDAWSLGVLLYTMVEAEVPFQKEKDIVECKLHHKRAAQLSDECKNLIALMLQKDEDLRPTIKQALEHPWLREHDSPIRCTTARKAENKQQSGHTASKLYKDVSKDSGIGAVQRHLFSGNRIASSDSPQSPT